ncbi:hypothetical protein N7499_004331 [Penicillium canescens]|nr:hypothetical protein N7444_008272 [Penicillium canescens]KAJ6084702.1 hypothetical protein N7499_004331 [Penicillium canescens]KAJ6161488.1 hypothetical protein N7485_009718 [Penicillium canescens]
MDEFPWKLVSCLVLHRASLLYLSPHFHPTPYEWHQQEHHTGYYKESCHRLYSTKLMVDDTGSLHAQDTAALVAERRCARWSVEEAVNPHRRVDIEDNSRRE